MSAPSCPNGVSRLMGRGLRTISFSLPGTGAGAICAGTGTAPPRSAAAVPMWITNARRVTPLSMSASPLRGRFVTSWIAASISTARGSDRRDCTGSRANRLRRGALSTAAGEPERAQRAERQEGHAEPEALALAGVRAQRPQHEAVGRADLAPGGEELTQALLLILRELGPPPLRVLLQRREAADFRLCPRQGLAALVPGLTLAAREKRELDWRHGLLEPVQPVVVHARNGGQEQPREPEGAAADQADAAQGFPATLAYSARETQPAPHESDARHHRPEGGDDGGARGEIPGERRPQPEHADEKAEGPACHEPPRHGAGEERGHGGGAVGVRGDEEHAGNAHAPRQQHASAASQGIVPS